MRKTVTLLLFLAFLGFKVQAQSEKFKALFVYNFTKYVQWPAPPNPEGFVIGVLGNSSIADELKTIATKQKVGSQTMIVKVYSSVSEIGNCNIVYVSANKSSLLADLTTKTAGMPTLIVTEKEGAIAQACMNFILDGNKLKFEISKTNIDKRGLSASASLYALGIKEN